MSYLVQCQVCGVRVEADPQLVGQDMVCPECKEQFRVPITNITAGLVEGDLWIQRSLGTGDIGEMFLAKRLSNNQKLYLKALTPAVTVEPQATNAFLAALSRAGDLSHPNLLPVVETGMMAGQHIYVMPFQPGTSIQALVDAEGPMPERDALKIAMKTARCLRMVNEERGLVHGSLKPGNIVVDDEGEPYILELGNFKRVLAGSMLTLDHLNKAGCVADYMSPEQAQGWPQLDARSDIYALGATLYFMLTGRKPYEGPDTRTVLHHHLNSGVPDPRKLNSEVSAETADLVFGMMDKDPEERYQSWRELVDEMKDLLRSHAPGTETEIALKTQLHMHSMQIEQAAHQSKSPVMLIVMAFVAVLMLGLIILGLVFAMMQEDPVKDPAPVNLERRIDRRVTRNRQNARRPPDTPGSRINPVLQKKIEAILKFHKKNPEKTDFAVERLQMLLARDAKTDGEKAAVEKEIERLKTAANENLVDLNANRNGDDDDDDDDDDATPKAPQTAKQLRDFVFLGPLKFPPDKTWPYVQPKERRGLPNLALKIKSKDGKRRVHWQRLFPSFQSGKCELRRNLSGPKDNVHAYAVTTITARKETKARLVLGYDDDLVVWLNNEKVFDKKGHTREDAVKQPITLERGINILIVRCRNGSRDWWFSLRLTQPDNDLEPAGTTIKAPALNK